MSRVVFRVGLDVGSTTVKVVVLDEFGSVLLSEYQRHFSDVRKTVSEILEKVCATFTDSIFTIAVAGSGGISVSKYLEIPFVQEVIASTAAIRKLIPSTDVAIELGGEDAKITFFDSGVDQRMNETCAGGTGAFIDQMAAVLGTDVIGLNDLAEKHKTLYPIAARCGVFAKTDVMPLLNEGADKSDIAASILQAVVDQTIGGLACGRSIRGNIAFLGGPLFFITELRKRFVETLKLKPQNIIFPNNAHYFVAIGTAYLSENSDVISSNELLEKVKLLLSLPYDAEITPLPPLFKDKSELDDFIERHGKSHAVFIDIDKVKGSVYLGIDAGSTTTKAVVIDDNFNILYTWYGSNKGTPLKSVVEILKDLYSKLPYGIKIKNSAVTGYGESLLKAALTIDEGEVETLVHCKAASYFVPDVSFILDIGGQDMKCLYVKDRTVDKIILNEACSSGCGSFVENFANSLGMDIKAFANEALMADKPVDLGSRCTVFMNSKVKQAQKEGASIADISAGLSYSVVKNALYKVIKIAQPEELGKRIVVQGGTFFNNSILRALEKLLNVNVVRPNIAGLMGAFGAALLAKERSVGEKLSSIITESELNDFKVTSKNHRCKQCSNKCLITINIFNDGKKFVSGNRCEKGAGVFKKTNKLPNLYELKYKRLFDHYVPTPVDKAPMGIIGMPRVLNMYENYPFWFTFFTELGYHVMLSSQSSRELFDSGLETIPSQTACFPAKMVHGHINDLISKGVKKIFYPCIPYEKQEFIDSDDHFNCPVVANYPEVIRLNVDDLGVYNIDFIQPYLPIDDLNRLASRIHHELKKYGHKKSDIKKAIEVANIQMELFKKDIRKMGENTLNQIKKTDDIGIVLAGRPYHLDPAVNHGIPELIASHDVAVFTDDSVSHLADIPYKLDVVDQWVYHSRLYRAAYFTTEHNNIEFVQLNSFGCGLDAVTADQVEDILSTVSKVHTILKIDEGSNLGAVRIRIRSLLATIKDKINSKNEQKEVFRILPKPPVQFIKEMKDYTILCPQLSPIHLHLLSDCAKPYGYNIEVLPTVSKADIEEGLKYVNNDACFPAITVVGQLIHALKSGKYDLKKTALIISQTGGGCRATNYVRFLRSAAMKAGFADVPIIPFTLSSLTDADDNAGFSVSRGMVKRMLTAFLYGDLLLRVTNRTRPYEINKGEVDRLAMKWIEKLKPSIENLSRSEYKKNVKQIIKDFDTLKINQSNKPKVGIVGEILVKFHPDANNQLVTVIENEGGEAVVPDFMDFILYCSLDDVNRHKFLSGSFKNRIKSTLFISYIEWYRNVMRAELKNSKRFCSFQRTDHLMNLVNGLVSVGNQTGEGWLLTAEMVELIQEGVENIVLVQPFACLPNHITGKGVMKELKKRYNSANIVAVDYDPGASEVNQLNRIKLMMSVAFQNHDNSSKSDSHITR